MGLGRLHQHGLGFQVEHVDVGLAELEPPEDFIQHRRREKRVGRHVRAQDGTAEPIPEPNAYFRTAFRQSAAVRSISSKVRIVFIGFTKEFAVR